jgi:hypothetical protein
MWRQALQHPGPDDNSGYRSASSWTTDHSRQLTDANEGIDLKTMEEEWREKIDAEGGCVSSDFLLI